MHLPLLSEWLNSSDHNHVQGQECSVDENCFVKTFEELFHLYQRIRARTYLTTRELDNFNVGQVEAKDHAALADKQFPPNTQCDSAQFWDWIILQFSEYDSGIRYGSPPIVMLLLTNLAPRQQLTNGLFMLETRITKRCEDCGRETEIAASDESTLLRLPVVEPSINLPLRDYLQQFHDRDNTSRCESAQCSGKYPHRDISQFGARDAGKAHTAVAKDRRFPEYLVIQLSSFESGGSPQKIVSYPDYPLWLDLSEFQHNEALKAGNRLRYRLHSVVFHRGERMTHGHYTGVFTTPQGVVYIDNHRLDPEGETNVANFFNQKRPRSPYILTYVRVMGG